MIQAPDRGKRWVSPAPDKDAVQTLIQELGITRIVATLLVSRGYADPESARKFLYPSLDDLGDPTLLPDYAPAVKTLMEARENGDLIFVHGDYDVDGVTSAAIFDRFLRKAGFKVQTHVPNRKTEGYGIHLDAVHRAKASGAAVLLTCDVGIAAHNQVQLANELGMKVVVTDHHTIGEELPNAVAVINAHRKDSKYPFSEFSGAGVVFRFCEGIAKELGFPVAGYRRAYLDLAALGTIADVMPLIGENRIIAKFGLEALSTTQKEGLKALKEITEISGKRLSGYHVGFILGPRLNAVGRIDDAAMALQLLIESDPERAKELAEQIDKLNTARKLEQDRIIKEAIEMVLANHLHENKVLMVGNQGWNAGIVGIVASRLVETFGRPTFVFSVDPESGQYKGSGRSVAGFNLAEVISNSKDLVSGGGHEMAAGCAIQGENYDAAVNAFNSFAAEHYTDEQLTPALVTDMEVQPGEVTLDVLKELEILEPFGMANPKPTFFTRNVELISITPTKKPEHVNLMVRGTSNLSQKVIGFNFGDRFTGTKAGARADIAFTAEVNEWQDRVSVQWSLKDVKVLNEL